MIIKIDCALKRVFLLFFLDRCNTMSYKHEIILNIILIFKLDYVRSLPFYIDFFYRRIIMITTIDSKLQLFLEIQNVGEIIQCLKTK